MNFEIPGPYTSKDMLFWLQTGYFTENLQLRTENESSYHSLGEWTQVLGNVRVTCFNKREKTKNWKRSMF